MAGLFRHEPVHQPDGIRPAVAYSAEHYDRFVEIVRHVDGGISLKIGVAGPIAGTYRAEPPGLATVFIRHRWGGRIGVLWLSTQAGLLQPDDGEAALLTMIRAVVDEFHIVNGAAEQGGHRLWLGLLDRAVGYRLGGMAGLMATGHFVNVTQSTTGTYLVQTTPHLTDLRTDVGPQAPDQ